MMRRRWSALFVMMVPLVAVLMWVVLSPAQAHEGEAHGEPKPADRHEAHEKEHEAHDEKSEAAQGPVQLTGEVADLMCYIDHGALGDKHRQCAQRCIVGNGPVGLVVKQEDEDGQVHEEAYLVIGNHEPINAILAPLAAQTVTLEGKLVQRGGLKMLENVRIVKQ